MDDPHYTTPLYRKSDAARIVDVPVQTFRNWSVGYLYKRLDGSQVASEPIVTTLEPNRPQGASVPFIGLAEAYVVAAFTKAGVPMQRIRPAVRWLQEHIGLPQALASERLKTDGAEVLWEYAENSQNPDDISTIEGLVVIRNGQQIFRPAVNRYLKCVTYSGSWIRTIQLPQFTDIEVTVDPWMNGGQPTVALVSPRTTACPSNRSKRFAGRRETVTEEAAAARISFFVDRGIGSVIVPRALRDAGWILETMDERYGRTKSQTILDTQWIEEATLAGDALLCKDVPRPRSSRRQLASTAHRSWRSIRHMVCGE